jgi:hypothetical protein
MKLTPENVKHKTELTVKQQKEVKHTFIGDILPHTGHVIWEINDITLTVEKAQFAKTTFQMFGENKKEIIVKKGHSYISALNAKNALKKYHQGNNGSRKNPNPLNLF